MSKLNGTPIISNIFAEEILLPKKINQLLICNLQHECQQLKLAYHCFSQGDTLVDDRHCRELEIKHILTNKSYNGNLSINTMTYYVYMLRKEDGASPFQ
jgi:hypothetical protein